MSDFQKQLNKTANQLVKKAQQRQDRATQQIFYNASIISIYGMQIALPVVLGILLGNFMDKNIPHPIFSWRLNFIILGFILGVIDANMWLKKSFKIKRRKHD